MEDTYKIYKIIKISNENNKLELFNQKDEKHSFENNVQNNVQKLKATFRHDEKQISKVKKSFKKKSITKYFDFLKNYLKLLSDKNLFKLYKKLKKINKKNKNALQFSIKNKNIILYFKNKKFNNGIQILAGLLSKKLLDYKFKNDLKKFKKLCN